MKAETRRRTLLFAASWGYAGKIPFAPGTFGTLLGLPLCFVLSLLPLPGAAAFLAVFFAAAVIVSHATEKMLDRADPGIIVIDEVAGIMVTMLGISFTPATAIAAFFLFRLLDILKPFPIRWVERRTTGGFGVVIDDVLAGIAANVILRIGLMRDWIPLAS